MISPIKPIDTSFRQRADQDKQLQQNILKSVKQQEKESNFREVLNRILYNEGC